MDGPIVEFNSSLIRDDVFPSLTENNLARITAWSFSLISIVVAPPLFYFVIWYERYGNDNKRTLINMLMSMYCWTYIGFLLSSQVLEIVRFSYGPLPGPICCLQNILKSSVLCIALLLLDATQVTKYIYIFWLKNPTSFADDFWCTFVTAWIYLTSVIWMSTLNFITGCNSMGYLLCSGRGPANVNKAPATAYSIIVAFSLIVHIFSKVKIKMYRDSADQGAARSKKFFIADMNLQTLTHYTANFLIIVTLAGSVFCMHKLNNIELAQINEYPNYLFIYYINLFAPVFIINLNAASFFRKRMVRKSFGEEIMSLFRKVNITDPPVNTCCT